MTKLKKIGLFSIIITFIILIFGWPYYTASSLSGTVSSLEIKKIDNIDRYLVYIKDEEGKTNTFTIKDSLAHLQYRSSDLYGSLNIGDKVIVKGYGLRIPLYSKYKNIYDIKILESTSDKINDLKKYIFIEKDGNIYRYNISLKEIELYDTNIFNKIKQGKK